MVDLSIVLCESLPGRVVAPIGPCDLPPAKLPIWPISSKIIYTYETYHEYQRSSIVILIPIVSPSYP